MEDEILEKEKCLSSASVQFGRSVTSDSLRPCESQHASNAKQSNAS